MDMDWHWIDLKDPVLNSKAKRHLNQIWTGYSWNTKLIPDPSALLKWFRDRGLAVTLNDHPADGVQPHEAGYATFMRTMHEDPAKLETIPFNAGDLNYMTTFYQYTHSPLEKAGVDFWWLDWQQYPMARSVPEISNLAALNEFYFRQSQRDGKRGVSFSRWAGWGDQRHPIHFSGDASTSFKMLAAEVPFTSTAGNVGCFFWSHDIGGHMGKRNEESYARWCQFGAFSATLRSHSARNAAMDRRPWKYPKWAEDSMQISFQLRSRFFPYTYSSVRQSCAESVPLLRPIYLEYPKTEAAYHQPQQYFFGDNLLVAPVAEAGAGSLRLGRQAVWFPEGTWFNFFTGESFAGEQERLVAAALDEFPLYVRGGVPVPMTAFVARMATTPLTNLILRCYPGPNSRTGTFTLYEDDGISRQHETGSFAQTRLAYTREGQRITVRIGATSGSYAGQPAKRACVIELPCTEKAEWARVNGLPASLEFDPAARMNRVIVPASSIRGANEVVVSAKEADQNALCAAAFAKRAGLPLPGADVSLETLLAAALNASADSRLKEAILAASGSGRFAKNENPTGYPETKTEKYYSASKYQP
jgi:alpha-glucosidase (family GH31 glycosyl hydrolase)